MSSLSLRILPASSIQPRAFFIALLLTCFLRPAISATISSQDLGQRAIGQPSSQSIAVPAVTPGPATFSLRYSLDFSLGACTPSANGCLLSVTFDPVKPGLRQDAVIVKDAGGQAVEEILLHGVGLGPLPVFSPAVATFKASFFPLPTESFGVQGITAEPDGKILIAAGGIYRFDPVNNELSAIPGLAVDSSLYGNVFDNVATDAAGNIYYEGVGTTNLGIHRLDVITETDSLIANVSADAMAVDPSGVIFYVQRDQIFKILPNTNTPVLVAGNGTHGYAGDNGPRSASRIRLPRRHSSRLGWKSVHCRRRESTSA